MARRARRRRGAVSRRSDRDRQDPAAPAAGAARLGPLRGRSTCRIRCSRRPSSAPRAVGLLGAPPRRGPGGGAAAPRGRAAARGRPLLLLIDDAGSLPAETARGLAALRAARAGLAARRARRHRAARRCATATAPVRRHADARRARRGNSRQGVCATTSRRSSSTPARSARLREAFDDDVLEALGRAASGNPRRLHLAAQTFLRRAETGSSPEPVPVKPAADMEPPAPAPHAPPPGRPPPMPAAETPPTPARAAAPPPIREEPVARPPAARPRTEPAPPPPGRADRRVPHGAQPSAGRGADPAGARAGAARAGRSERAAPAGRPDVGGGVAAVGAAVAPVRPPWSSRSPRPAPRERALPARRAARRRSRWCSESPSSPPRSASCWRPGSSTAAARALPRVRRAQRARRAPAPEPVRAGEASGPDACAGCHGDAGADPEPAAIPNPVPAAAAVPKPAPAAAAAPAPVEMIEISINATPWAIVEMDGRELGETPLGGVRLARGTHRFVARFPDGRVVERSSRDRRERTARSSSSSARPRRVSTRPSQPATPLRGSGRSAAWLARQTGGLEVESSNLSGPTST